jgi:nucleotide-binding universal stress UspA family protein
MTLAAGTNVLSGAEQAQGPFAAGLFPLAGFAASPQAGSRCCTRTISEITMSTNASTNVLLAVDVAPGCPLRHVSAAVDMTRELIHYGADRVLVLHVREFSIARLGRMMTDGGGAAGQRAVDEIVSGLRAAGIQAHGQVREADVGHVAQAILDEARDFDAHVIVLGSRSRTDLPRIPFGVATHVLHLATLPVLIVPMTETPPAGGPPSAEVTMPAAAGAAG